ncbi:MAG: hypothetical protein LBH64_05290, partial [Coriobacteriales bacterium]|nr:hypothetical protein [Coriobacteriales bacterium]
MPDTSGGGPVPGASGTPAAPVPAVVVPAAGTPAAPVPGASGTPAAPLPAPPAPETLVRPATTVPDASAAPAAPVPAAAAATPAAPVPAAAAATPAAPLPATPVPATAPAAPLPAPRALSSHGQHARSNAVVPLATQATKKEPGPLARALAKLSLRERVLIIGLLIAAIIAAVAFLIVLPALDRISTLSTEVSTLREERDNLHEKTDLRPQYQEQYDKALKDYENYQRFYYPFMDPETIDASITNLMLANGLSPKSLTMGPLADEDLPHYLALLLVPKPLLEGTSGASDEGASVTQDEGATTEGNPDAAEQEAEGEENVTRSTDAENALEAAANVVTPVAVEDAIATATDAPLTGDDTGPTPETGGGEA